MSAERSGIVTRTIPKQSKRPYPSQATFAKEAKVGHPQLKFLRQHAGRAARTQSWLRREAEHCTAALGTVGTVVYQAARGERAIEPSIRAKDNVSIGPIAAVKVAKLMNGRFGPSPS